MGSGLLSRWLSSHYHGGVHDEMSMAHHTVNLLTSTIKIDADRAGQQGQQGNMFFMDGLQGNMYSMDGDRPFNLHLLYGWITGQQGQQGNMAAGEIPCTAHLLVPKINGEMPSVDEAISDHQNLLGRDNLGTTIPCTKPAIYQDTAPPIPPRDRIPSPTAAITSFPDPKIIESQPKFKSQI